MRAIIKSETEIFLDEELEDMSESRQMEEFLKIETREIISCELKFKPGITLSQVPGLDEVRPLLSEATIYVK